MQIITSKSLPPLSSAIIKRYASKNGTSGDRINLGVKYCPSMDLIATYPLSPNDLDTESSTSVSNEAEFQESYGEEDDEAATVDVWRLNGQQVFSIAIEPQNSDTSKVDVIEVSWRDDGQIIAVVSSDNIVRLVHSFSGKTIRRFSSESKQLAPSPPRPTLERFKRKRPSTLNYSTHFSTPWSARHLLESATRETDVVLDDLLGLNADIAKLLRSKADLPRELAAINVEAFLPRLSCLPPVGFGVEDIFSSRNSIDAMFHSSQHNLKAGTLDLLMVGREDGRIHLRIYGSFEIGDIDISTGVGLPKERTWGPVANFITHPFSGRAFVIASSDNLNGTSLHLVDLDLRFINRSPTTLPVLANKATQLHNLVRYLHQLQSQLAKELKTAFELPSRLTRPLNQDLIDQEGEGSSFVTAVYHTLVTGEVSSVLREWFTDVLTDRGVKRWEKAVGDCLELVRRLVSEGWAPAVERAGVVLSRLAGLSACNVQADGEALHFGLDKRLVKDLRETIDVMAIRGEDLLGEVSRELAGFGSFVKWLKWEVEAATLEDTSERLDEMRENSDHSELLKVMEYIENDPTNTSVKSYVGEAPDQIDPDETGASFYADFKERRNNTVSQQTKAPTFGQLLIRMQMQCEKLFEQIALSLRQRILVTYMSKLPFSTSNQILDTRLLFQSGSERPQIHIMGLDRDKAQLSYVVLDTGNDAKQHTRYILRQEMDMPGKGEIMDAKFVDDFVFFALVKIEGQVQIHSHALLHLNENVDNWQLRHTFNESTMAFGMRPLKLEINGRKGRRAVAVVDENGKGYTVFDLDSTEEVATPDKDAVMD